MAAITMAKVNNATPLSGPGGGGGGGGGLSENYDTQ